MSGYVWGLVSGVALCWIGLSLYGVWPFLVATVDEAVLKLRRRFGRRM